MKSNMTRSEFNYNVSVRCPWDDKVVIKAVLDTLGIEFKQEIDWEAETHDPSVIPDKWLVECWNGTTHLRQLSFFDKANICCFRPTNGRRGYIYHNYRAIKKEDWPKWAIEAHKSLED